MRRLFRTRSQLSSRRISTPIAGIVISERMEAEAPMTVNHRAMLLQGLPVSPGHRPRRVDVLPFLVQTRGWRTRGSTVAIPPTTIAGESTARIPVQHRPANGSLTPEPESTGRVPSSTLPSSGMPAGSRHARNETGEPDRVAAATSPTGVHSHLRKFCYNRQPAGIPKFACHRCVINAYTTFTCQQELNRGIPASIEQQQRRQ